MKRRLVAGLGAVVLMLGLLPAGVLGAGLTGAVFTTSAACNGTNINIFASKDAVFLDGGPAHTGAAGLPDGEYYVQVTEPGGELLGTSIGSGDDTPVVVSGGEFAVCYQLSAILVTASLPVSPGYDTTSNGGGEYKVWVSQDAAFAGANTKTDNFKVKTSDTEPPQATINVIKFYDANANGINDDELEITGWKVRIQDEIDYIRFTPVSIIVDPDDYSVTEFSPVQSNWIHTTGNPVVFTLGAGEEKTVEFGNVCLGAGGGLTLGFWSNKNGQALIGADDIAMLVALNLRNANGTAFDPANKTAFRTWILGATATNMAYMLSAQLAAMELNVLNGKVTAGSLIYAPGATSANGLGFATVSAVMAEADASLGANAVTVASGPVRTYQEALKDALDRANNNLNFVQATPCAFSFAE